MYNQPISWKMFIPAAVISLIVFLFVKSVKIGKSKILSMPEQYNITPPYLEIMRPLIMVCVLLTICLLMPVYFMPYLGFVFFFIGYVSYEYSKVWRKLGFSIASYIIIIVGIIIISTVVSFIFKGIINNIISLLGRYYNVI